MGDEQQIVRVTSAIIIENSNGKVLMGRRSINPIGMWVFPGGGVKFGETLAEAAIREAREETGLDVEIKQFVKVSEVINDRFHRIVFFYKGYAKGGTAQASDDIDKLEWFSLDEIQKLDNLGDTVLDLLKFLALTRKA